MPSLYKIKNWEKFQHYKDRNPPWIKLHCELMHSEDWVVLSDASKLLLIVCMMVGSKDQGNVPNNPAYIKRVGYLDKLPDFKPLLECGFLIEVLADDTYCNQSVAPSVSVSVSLSVSDSVVKDSKLNRKEDFEKLWAAWQPYDMGKGNKAKAADSFSKTMGLVNLSTLIERAGQYTEHCKRTRCKTQHVVTWLNQRGWETEYSQADENVAEKPENKSFSKSAGPAPFVPTIRMKKADASPDGISAEERARALAVIEQRKQQTAGEMA
jgi:hypothetical protein